MAAKITKGTRGKSNRVIFRVPAISLVDQTVAAFEADGLDGIGVMQANHLRTDTLAPIQVASVQRLARRHSPYTAVVIVEEGHIRIRPTAQTAGQDGTAASSGSDTARARESPTG